MNLSREEVTKGIIDGYRNVVLNRYQLEYLNQHYTIPAELTTSQIDELRSYFLEHIYPPYEQRMALNEAFDSLDEHIRQPSHMMKIIMDSSRLLFRYGLRLPSILKAGIKALKSFRTASRFENQLIDQALQLDQNPPYTEDQIKAMIANLPYEDISAFMNQGEDLFSIIYDTKLVKSIIKILDSLITKMKRRPNVYSKSEVEGFAIGQEIITKGFALFENLSARNQTLLLEKVIEIERSELANIHAQKQ